MHLAMLIQERVFLHVTLEGRGGVERARERERTAGKRVVRSVRRKTERARDQTQRTLGERHPRTEACTRHRRRVSQGRRNSGPPQRAATRH